MYRYATAIGIDIGKAEIKVAVVRFGGDVLFEEHFPLGKHWHRDKILEHLISSVVSTRQKMAGKELNPIAVGISAKGFIDHENGVVLGPGHGIRNWKNVPLAETVGKAIGLPVYVGNDANLMTIAEQRFGAAHGYRHVVYVALRTGIGGGIIIDGKLYRGINNAGGEIGQMIINYAGGRSDTGINGSFEYFASAEALVRQYCQEKGINVTTGMHLSAKDVFDLRRQNDPAAVKTVKENAWLVGIGLSNLIAIFAPEIIVLGGGMAEAGSDYIRMIRQSAFANSLKNCRSEVMIRKAGLGQRAALIGAAYYSLTRLAGKGI